MKVGKVGPGPRKAAGKGGRGSRHVGELGWERAVGRRV